MTYSGAIKFKREINLIDNIRVVPWVENWLGLKFDYKQSEKKKYK